MEFIRVDVKEGAIQGKKAITYNGKAYCSFEGIPYAKPPLGKLRFKDPTPIEPWNGVYDATKPGEKCAQKDPYSNTGKFTGSEDCLYLNVYAPCIEKDKNYPVLFFIHGGRYILGYGDYYRPDFYLEEDCIVVTVNYRLHVLGFLCLNTADVPGNAGLKDMVLALKWVKNNISYFGGDSNNIVVFGESAGAGSISSFLVSKMTDNLFDKVILESGSCLSDLYKFTKADDILGKAKFVAAELGHDTDDVDELLDILQSAKVEDLVETVKKAELSRMEINAYFLPVIEKEFPNVERMFSEDPWIPYTEGRIKKVPTIIGVASHEGAYFLFKNKQGEIMYMTDMSFFIPSYLNLDMGSHQAQKYSEALLKFYFGNREVNDKTKLEYLDFVSDAYFNRDMTITMDLIARTNPELYVYTFSYAGNMSTKIMKSIDVKGASHSDILAYQFLRKNKMNNLTKRDENVINYVKEAWCNFAKTGNPSTTNPKRTWLPYNTTRKYSMNIGDEIEYGPYPFTSRVKLWTSFMQDKCKL